MNSRYGDHAEAAAAALTQLLQGAVLPEDAADRSRALDARHVLVQAIRERLRSQFLVTAKATDPAARTAVTMDLLLAAPQVQLGYVAERLPLLPPDQRTAPTFALTASSNPITQAWVVAARESVIANHILDTDPSRRWLTDPGARAALTSDTAQLLEAVTILDSRLQEVSALNHHVAIDAAPSRLDTTARLVASSVDRISRWGIDRQATDLATSTAWHTDDDQQWIGPIRLVRTPGDLIDAQHNLARLLRPMSNRNLRHPFRLSASDTMILAANQTVLLTHLRERITRSSSLADHLPRLQRLNSALDDAVKSVRGLHNASGHRSNRRLSNQQQEISVGVRQGHIGLLDDDQASRLLQATQDTLTTWSQAVRREACRKSSDFRIARRGPIESPIYGRLTPDGTAAHALAALIDLNAQVLSVPEPPSLLARGELHEVLAYTPPTETVDPSPSPGGRRQRLSPPTTPAGTAKAPARGSTHPPL